MDNVQRTRNLMNFDPQTFCSSYPALIQLIFRIFLDLSNERLVIVSSIETVSILLFLPIFYFQFIRFFSRPTSLRTPTV